MSGEYFEKLNREISQLGSKVIGHFDVVKYLLGDKSEDAAHPKGGFFEYYNNLWDEAELGPKPVSDPLDLLQKNKDGTPIVHDDADAKPRRRQVDGHDASLTHAPKPLVGTGESCPAWCGPSRWMSSARRTSTRLEHHGIHDGDDAALGGRKRKSALLALAGAVLGVALSLLTPLFDFSTENFGTGSEMTFHFVPSPPILLGSLALGVLVGLVGGLFPALAAARVRPLPALRA
jgi:hypothetical protein